MIVYIFMVEEESIEPCIKKMIQELSPNISYRVIIHDGKQDLEKSIPRKLRAFQNYDDVEYKFVILRDQDSSNCIALKQRLYKMCCDENKNDSIVRIVCNSLEGWFLGDLDAIALTFNVRVPSQKKKKFRNPDIITNPIKEIETITSEHYSKVSNARKISQNLDLERNVSNSFNVFKETIVSFNND